MVHEWSADHENEIISMPIAVNLEEIRLCSLSEGDIPVIVQAFTAIGWNKPATIYENYLQEQEQGGRDVRVAWYRDCFAGYVTLKWKSDYPPFKAEGVPEIKDLNVLPDYRQQGIGSLLLNEVEAMAFMKSAVAGLGVGLTADYQDAFRIYIKRGYLPDGRGLYHPDLEYGSVRYGDRVVVDDDCTLWLTKSKIADSEAL